MFKKLLVGVAVLVVALVVVVVLQPATFSYERSATIGAPPEVAFALVNDFHQWDRWSPWAGRDPNQTTTFEGAPSGKGAIQKWAGNDEVGEGQMTILESRAPEQIDLRLEFLKPFASVAQTSILFAPEGDGATKVTWRMSGDNDFMGKAMSLVMDMDAMIGKDFEQGLASLGTAAAEDAKKAAAAAAEAEAARVAEAAAAQAEAEATADAEGAGEEDGLPQDAVAAPAAP